MSGIATSGSPTARLDEMLRDELDNAPAPRPIVQPPPSGPR
jgi:hypothetical protein